MSYRVPTCRPTLQEALGGDPTAAEERLLAAAKAGDGADYGETRPEAASAENTLRAGLIRFLLLGGDADNPVSPRGVMARGAWIARPLDFTDCETQLHLLLRNCHFAEAPDFIDAHLGALFLPGCAVPGIRLHRLRTEGAVQLGDGFRSAGTVDLGGARIGGQLDCSGGSFAGTITPGTDGSEQIGPALNGDGLTVGAAVLLSAGFVAQGEVRLVGARITGQLACKGGSFDGIAARGADGSEQIGAALNGDGLTVGASALLGDGFVARGAVNLGGARISGQLVCGRGSFDGITARGADGSGQIGEALNGDTLTVGAGFIWHGITGLRGGVDLSEAKVGALIDDAASWAEARPLEISGFGYQALQSRMGIRERLGWLAGKHEHPVEPTGFGARLMPGGCADFDPRPYTQLARVLARDGQRGNAELVLLEREHRLRAAERRRAIARMQNGRIVRSCIGIAVRWVLNLGFGLLFGYGHAPIQAIYWTVLSVGLSALFFDAVYERGQFAPNSAVVLTSADWRAALAGGCPPANDPGFATRQAAGCVMPLQLWAGGEGAAMPTAADYETFQPGLYAFDLFVPLIDLGQTAAWAPSKARGVWGWAAFYARMPLQTLGWILAVVGAAVLTGLVGRREE